MRILKGHASRYRRISLCVANVKTLNSDKRGMFQKMRQLNKGACVASGGSVSFFNLA